MRIAVVNYEEISPPKTICEIWKDILDFRKQMDEFTEKAIGSELRCMLDKLIVDHRLPEIDYIDTSTIEKRNDMIIYLQGLPINLLVTYNLAGFEQSTLTDGLAYNLVDCRQFHFIEKSDLTGEQFVHKEKSINMFFSLNT